MNKISVMNENLANKIAAGVYRMEYIKNNKFSELEKISETKLEDYKEKDFSTLCSE